MKILMPNHFPLQGSGSGIYALNVALELLRAGHEVMGIVPEHRPVDEYPFETRTIIFRDPAGRGEGETRRADGPGRRRATPRRIDLYREAIAR